MNRTSDTQKLYFQVLRVPAADVEDKAMFYIAFRDIDKRYKVLPVFLDLNHLSCEDLVQSFNVTAHMYDLKIKNPIRVLSCDNLVLRIFSPGDDLSKEFRKTDIKFLRIEEVPDDHLHLKEYEWFISVNLRTLGSTNYCLDRSIVIKISINTTYANMIDLIEENVPNKISSISIYSFLKQKHYQLPSDLSTIIDPDIFFNNQTDPTEPNNYVIPNVCILVEVTDSTVPRRYFKSDPSIKINHT
ncbi:hypothetical protein RF11_08854 [Thelohanellus kitauei]|uniref:Uncharacterized protein n=1 Tax=Thelohanellus kitauei TaxID=669202 RepID=A0A0C2I937_THEKT|nr:hypothetical protein RF11_08854 [Thelohanellus kitauei]